MKKMKKSLIVAGCAGMMMSIMLSLPAAAYGNGTKSIMNNNGTKLGFAEMWTNNASTGKFFILKQQ